MTAADSTDFQAYLESICSDEKYQGWQDFYTPTDALHRQRIEKKQPPRWLNLSLMVQTIVPPPEREAPGDKKAEKEKVERLEVLGGLRKYAENHVLLVGKPGSGKSTALERLLWEEAEKARTQRQGKIPVLVQLRRYKTSVLGIIGDVKSDNQAVVVSAIHEEIKRNPTIKARLWNALKAGGTEALKQALDAIFKNPAVSISVETIKGFIEAE
ncbi:hypothetical protein [Microseira wollei]|uniref:PBS lyase HEAT-like repeat domain protein n=1 Tax=Microseira wollei NIES-4236 TaxID=2530354 RepID=A0AAV3XJX2_9CYAN|nr:hypothetical protein [Microseira wollei]GET43217.1 PBS lyase HEAT-like repeat domain protein [Microseira wollei NIES-4236]